MSDPLRIPVGTKVVSKARGHVGVVASIPAAAEQRYLIRFADGRKESFCRADLAIFKHMQSEVPGAPDAADLRPFVIYRCIVGSTAHGLNQEGSDVDRRGFYLPPADLQWALAGIPEQLENDNEEVYWEIEKFIRLALKANPNVLECLYSPLVETCTPLARELIGMRHVFLSRNVYRTYNAYVLSQFKKLEQDLRYHGQIRWKHLMHLIRLLLSGVQVLTDGIVTLCVEEHRGRLLAIRKGELQWDEVERWRLDLHRQLDAAFGSTELPEHPDYSLANQFLLRARRFAASEDYTK